MPRVNPELRQSATLLNSGAVHLLRALRCVDRETGVTPARLSALSVLVFSGPKMLGRLADIEGVAGSTMTRIVDGLCTLGLATRTPHPDSARATLIVATPQGVALVRRARRRRVEVISEALAGLTSSSRRRLVAAADDLAHLGDEVNSRVRP